MYIRTRSWGENWINKFFIVCESIGVCTCDCKGTFLCSPLILCALKLTLHAAYPLILWYYWYQCHSMLQHWNICSWRLKRTSILGGCGTVWMYTHPYRYAAELGSLFEFCSIAIKVKWHRKREYTNSRRTASSATFLPTDTHYRATRLKKNFRIKNIFQISALL